MNIFVRGTQAEEMNQEGTLWHAALQDFYGTLHWYTGGSYPCLSTERLLELS